MDETTTDLFAGVRMTLRNLCAAGCGKEHSPQGKLPATMIPEIGMVCAECTPAGTAKFIDEYPQKLMPIPSYKKIGQ